MLYEEPDEPMPDESLASSRSVSVATFIAGCVFSAVFAAALFYLFFCGR